MTGAGENSEIPLLRFTLPQGDDALELITFHAGGELFALPMECVVEALDNPLMVRLPDSSPQMLGIVTVGGQSVKLYSCSKFLGVGERAERPEVLLLRGDGGEVVGLVVDELASSMVVLGSSLRRVTALEDVPGALAALFFSGSRIVSLMDPNVFIRQIRESRVRVETPRASESQLVGYVNDARPQVSAGK